MSTVKLSRNLLPHLHHINEAHTALNVLIALLLNADVNLRSVATIETLCKEVGASRAAITAGKKHLERLGMIVLVPYDMRQGDERLLHPAQHIYQLTGFMKLPGNGIVDYIERLNESEDGES